MTDNGNEILISGFHCRTYKQTDQWRNSRCGKIALFAHLISVEGNEYEPVCGRHAAMYRNRANTAYHHSSARVVATHWVVVDLVAQIGDAEPPFDQRVVDIVRQMRTDAAERATAKVAKAAQDDVDATRAQTVRAERKWQERAITYTVAETTNTDRYGGARTEWVVSGLGGQVMSTIYLTSEDGEPDEIAMTGHLVATTPSFARALAEAYRMAASAADRSADDDLAAARRWADSTRD